MDLVLAPGLLEQVIEHAKASYPQEACGFLVGISQADRFIPMANVLASSSEYEMDPAEVIGVFRNLRISGENLVAIYHSHPYGPAQPSKTDVDRAHYPEAAYLIISLADAQRPQAAAFRILEAKAREIEVHVIV